MLSKTLWNQNQNCLLVLRPKTIIRLEEFSSKESNSYSVNCYSYFPEMKSITEEYTSQNYPQNVRQSCFTKLQNGFFFFQNNPKCLDPSCKTTEKIISQFTYVF